MSLLLNQLKSISNNTPSAVLKEIKQLIDELNIIDQVFYPNDEFTIITKSKIIIDFASSLFLGLEFIKKVIDSKIISWIDVYERFSDPLTFIEELEKSFPIFPKIVEEEYHNFLPGKTREILRGISWGKKAKYLSDEFNWYNNHLNPDENAFRSVTFDIFDQILNYLRHNGKNYSFYKGTVYTPYFVAKQLAEKLVSYWFNSLENNEKRKNAYNNLKVLDPAVGTGIFLIAAGNVILEKIIHKSPSVASISLKKCILDKNLYGIDTDKSACYVTKIKLLLWLIEEKTDVIFDLTELKLNINIGDALIGFLQIAKGLKNTEIKKETLSDAYHLHFQKELAIYQLPEHLDFLEVIKLINTKYSNIAEKENFKFFIIEGVMKDWNEYKNRLNGSMKTKVYFSHPDNDTDKRIRLYAVFKDRISDKAYIKSNSMISFRFDNLFHWCNLKNQSKYGIIIGNPPFIALTDLPLKARLQLKVLFPDIYTGNNDLSYFFLERMLSVLDENGILGFILPKYIQTSVFGEKIRSSLLTNKTLKEFHDFTNIPIFSNTKINTCFISIKKQKPPNNHMLVYYKYLKDDLKQVQKIKFPQSKLNPTKWIIMDLKLLNLIKHIRESSNKKLSDVAMISKGIETGCDKIFAPRDPHFFSRSLKLNPSNYRSWIKGKEIKQFLIEREGLEVLYAPKSRQLEIQKDVKAFQYLEKNKSLLLDRSRLKEYYLWRDGDERNTMSWENSKIVCPYKSKINRFAIDSEGSLSSKDVTWIIPNSKYSDKDYLYILLGLLNSKVSIFYAQSMFKDLGCFYDFYPKQIKEFPLVIPEKTSSEFKNLVEVTKRLVDSILPQKRERLKLELDKMVYQLYNLNEDAVNQIELNILI